MTPLVVVGVVLAEVALWTVVYRVRRPQRVVSMGDQIDRNLAVIEANVVIIVTNIVLFTVGSVLKAALS